MKIIDLLNKIANYEGAPILIKYDGTYYKWYERLEDKYNYKEFDIEQNKYLEYYLDDMYFITSILNDEVEIIEEDKKIPEKIKSNGKDFYCDNIDSWIDKEKTSAYCEYLMNKYNDLIDYLESKGE